MNKKKIIFVNNNMKTGGIQKSLCNLLNEISDYYDITLCLFDNSGDYLQDLPENISIIGCNGFYRFLGFSQSECKNPLDTLLRGLLALITRVLGLKFSMKIINLFQKKISEEYDCAISFLHEGSQKSFYGGCNQFVLKKIRTKKKITWLHCDFSMCGANNDVSKKIYRKFDNIVACSEGCKASFVKCMPELEGKCIAIRNCNDYNRIKELAQNGIEYDKEYFNIVTVARLSKEKGIDRAIEAVKLCVEKGHRIKYHIVGHGIEESKLKELVRVYELEDVVKFYGNQSNPYQYMVNADLFLLTSYHEAAPMVFDEAACLGLPVLATKTTSTDEMIIENEAGFVCENSDESIKSSLLDILDNTDKLNSIKNGLRNREFNNEIIVNQFVNYLID